MDCQDRKVLYDSLQKKINEEAKLQAMNDFLLGALSNRLKMSYQEEEVTTGLPAIHEILTKKLLEYREIRNYTVIEKDEEMRYMEELRKSGDEAKKSVASNMEDIKKKLFAPMCGVNVATQEYVKKIREQNTLYTTNLNKILLLISDKSRAEVKLKSTLKNQSKKSTPSEANQNEYQILLLKKRELENLHFQRQNKIEALSKKLNKHIFISDQLHKINKVLTTQKIREIQKLRNQTLLDIKKECDDLEPLNEKFRKDSLKLNLLQNKFRLYLSPELVQDYRKIKMN